MREDEVRRKAIAWVERTCAEQGVPVKITDPLVLARVAAILQEGHRNQEKFPQA
jgi:hypothetical protein